MCQDLLFVHYQFENHYLGSCLSNSQQSIAGWFLSLPAKATVCPEDFATLRDRYQCCQLLMLYCGLNFSMFQTSRKCLYQQLKYSLLLISFKEVFIAEWQSHCKQWKQFSLCSSPQCSTGAEILSTWDCDMPSICNYSKLCSFI